MAPRFLPGFQMAIDYYNIDVCGFGASAERAEGDRPLRPWKYDAFFLQLDHLPVAPANRLNV